MIEPTESLLQKPGTIHLRRNSSFLASRTLSWNRRDALGRAFRPVGTRAVESVADDVQDSPPGRYKGDGPKGVGLTQDVADIWIVQRCRAFHCSKAGQGSISACSGSGVPIP